MVIVVEVVAEVQYVDHHHEAKNILLKYVVCLSPLSKMIFARYNLSQTHYSSITSNSISSSFHQLVSRNGLKSFKIDVWNDLMAMVISTLQRSTKWQKRWNTIENIWVRNAQFRLKTIFLIQVVVMLNFILIHLVMHHWIFDERKVKMSLVVHHVHLQNLEIVVLVDREVYFHHEEKSLSRCFHLSHLGESSD